MRGIARGRHGARPARLAHAVIHRLGSPRLDGKSTVSFDPLTLIERLVARIPPSRGHRDIDQGVLARAAPFRYLIVSSQLMEVRQTPLQIDFRNRLSTAPGAAAPGSNR